MVYGQVGQVKYILHKATIVNVSVVACDFILLRRKSGTVREEESLSISCGNVSLELAR